MKKLMMTKPVTNLNRLGQKYQQKNPEDDQRRKEKQNLKQSDFRVMRKPCY